MFTLGLGLTTPYSLGVLVWNLYETFVTVSIEFWLRFEPQIRPTRLAISFLLITARAERKIRSCVKLFDFFSWVNTPPFDQKFVAFFPEFSGDSYVEFQEKTISGEFFRNFRTNQSYPIPKTCEISPYLLQFLFCVRIALKKFKQVLSYVFCTQVRRHVHKRITKSRYGEEKPGRFVFGKQVLFTLGLKLTTPYSLGVLVWNLYNTFVTVSIEFWLRFVPDIRPTRLSISFLFITARAERKVRSCVKLFNFFRGWILIRLTWNFLRFVPNSVEILTWNFRKKLFWENFSEILRKLFTWNSCVNFSVPKLVKFRPTFRNFYFASVLRRKKNSHKYFHMLFLPR